MTGRRAIVALSLLSTLVLCAFAAPHAMVIPAETETEITTTNSSTEGKVVKPKLKGTLAGIAFELEASSFMSCEGKTTVENKWSGGEQPEATGIFCGEFTGVVVNKPAKCEIEKGTVKLLENGTGRTMVKEQEMYVELSPAAGKLLSEFTFAGGECALKNAKVSVTGSITANFSTVFVAKRRSHTDLHHNSNRENAQSRKQQSGNRRHVHIARRQRGRTSDRLDNNQSLTATAG